MPGYHETDDFADPEAERFPMPLVLCTYLLATLAAGGVYMATTSLIWATAAMFASGAVVPFALVLTPGVRRIFIKAEAPALKRSDAVSRELQAWQVDLQHEKLEAEVASGKMARLELEKSWRTG